jgi:hypothetical protein
MWPFGESNAASMRSAGAFSSEVDTGSREENASKQEELRFWFNRNRML